MMQAFNVLDAQQSIHQHYLLEASAGTGKTFAIENLVVRLIIEASEENAPQLEEILVVTFTRAAARDLRFRIRRAIQQAIHLLSLHAIPESAPSYLIVISDPSAKQTAKRRLQEALFNFERSSIYTIHSFCAQSLQSFLFEGDMSCRLQSAEIKVLTKRYLQERIRDFLRSEIREENYSSAQLLNYCRKLNWDSDAFVKTLLRYVSSSSRVDAPLDLMEQFEQFLTGMRLLKQQGVNSTQLMDDFRALAPRYEGMARKIPAAIEKKFQRFAAFFDYEEWDREDFETLILLGCPFLDYLKPDKLTKTAAKKAAPTLLIPNLQELLQEHLGHIPALINHHSHLEARLVHDCQRHISHHLEEEEMMRHDDLLEAMAKACQQTLFAHKVRSCYKAAIVDEFQDTDPVQWSILKTLFLPQDQPWKGFLYLVGDPKQSIYAFRKADIYTYLDAQAALPAGSLATLDTNYRSEPSLLTALNAIFHAERIPQFIHLPKRQLNLPYRPVQAGVKEQTHWKDGLGSLHVTLVNLEKSRPEEIDMLYLMPYFAQEVKKLQEQTNIPLNKIAILVSDRYQAERAATILKQWQIPCMLQRCSNLAESSAMICLKEALQAILNPRHDSILKQALGNRLFSFSYQQLCDLEQPEYKAFILANCQQLKQLWKESGFSPFFNAFLRSSWQFNSLSIAEQLLQQGNEGEVFYCDLQQIADLLTAHQTETRCTPEELLSFLEELPLRSDEDEDALKRRCDSTCQAVSILTIHSSKGLEYDVVYPIGLHPMLKSPKGLLPLGNEGALAAIAANDPRLIAYEKEQQAEALRFLYVALTRAKKRLYLPIINDSHLYQQGGVSALKLFLSRFQYQSDSFQQGLPAFLKFLEEQGAALGISYTTLTPQPSPILSDQESCSLQLQPPPPLPAAAAPRWMHSFTSLSRSMMAPKELMIAPPKDFQCLEKTSYTLPAGAETGIFLHRLLQLLPLHLTTKEAISCWLHPYLSQPPFTEWHEPIASMLYHALNQPLPSMTLPFALADVNPNSVYREIEFFFSTQEMPPLFAPLSPDSFLRGAIDLIFCHEGYYYILDWKSNWLGGDSTAYTNENLKQVFDQQGYRLQAQLYAQALKRYLENVETRPFDSCFGGVYTLFLRALPDQQGILWTPSSELGLEIVRFC